MHRTFVAAVAMAVLAGVVANCGDHTTGTSNVPTAPTTPIVGFRIDGPPTIAPGQTVQFAATATLSPGTTADYTQKVSWNASPSSVLTITHDTGQATGQSVGDATISAAFQTLPCCQAHVLVTVLPANTYRLTGKVMESGFPVQGARITVQSGVGAGLAATTDDGGVYRLYGVAGPIQIKFSKLGYDDIVKSFTAAQTDVLDFPEAHQTAGIPSLAGAYTLTLTADPACPTVLAGGISPLPDDFRQPRNYAASLTQDGPSVTVTLTDPQMVRGQNQFTGRVEPDAIEFQLGSPYYSYDLTELIAERLSATQEFAFAGYLQAQQPGSAITGRLVGALAIVTMVTPYFTSGLCTASNHQVTLTRVAQPARHR
jgi:hypothetical protein